MNGTLHAAALAVLCVFAGGEGGKGGAAPPAAPAAGDLKTLRSDFGTWEFQAPTGYTEETPKKPNIERMLRYSGQPYLSTLVKIRSLDGIYTKPEHLEKFMKFLESDIGGNITYEGDLKNRFASDIQNAGTWWISLVDGKIEGTHALAIEILVPKDVYEQTRDTWIAVADSFKTFPPPPEPYTVPTGWKLNKNAMFAAMGPLSDLKDKKARDLLERRLAQVQSLLDVDQPATKLYRAIFNDERKVFPRCPVHVQPTNDAFKAEAGDKWVEGVAVLYLPDHPERILLVNGDADGGLRDENLLVEAGVQYVGSRLGKMAPWLRAAFRLYIEGGLKSRATPGLYPPEMLKRVKEVFAKTPAAFDDLVKADDAAMAALGDDGRFAAWGLLQYGLHGPDAAMRNLFRGFLRDGVDAPDLAAVWEKCLARHKTETKRPFKSKDLDAAAKKYFRDMKEEKR